MAVQIILTQDVPTLGDVGEVVNVKSGYARNFLLPRNMAVVASVKNRKRFEHQKRQIGFKAIKAREAAAGIAAQLAGLTLEVQRKVGDQDKLFGSVTTLDIEQALKAQGVEIDRRRIKLADPIKTLGEFVIPIKLQADLMAEIKVTVSGEES